MDAEGTTVGSVDQAIVDGLHPIDENGGSIASSQPNSVHPDEEDDLPSVESLSADEDGPEEVDDANSQDNATDGNENDDGPREEGETTHSTLNEESTFARTDSSSAWHRDAFSGMSQTDARDTRKRTIIRELEECAPDIVEKYGLSVNDTSLQTLQYELEQFHTKQQLDTQVKFLELGLMAVCYGIEFVNRRVLQSFLALDGWGDNTSKSLGQFRSCLRRIAIRFFSTRRERSEIMELGMLLLGHMAWYHFQNTSRSMWERVNRSSSRSRRRKKHRSAQRSEAASNGTGGSDQKTDGARSTDGPRDTTGDDDETNQSDGSESSSGDDVDEDLEASTTTGKQPELNLVNLLSQLV